MRFQFVTCRENAIDHQLWWFKSYGFTDRRIKFHHRQLWPGKKNFHIFFCFFKFAFLIFSCQGWHPDRVPTQKTQSTKFLFFFSFVVEHFLVECSFVYRNCAHNKTNVLGINLRTNEGSQWHDGWCRISRSWVMNEADQLSAHYIRK